MLTGVMAQTSGLTTLVESRRPPSPHLDHLEVDPGPVEVAKGHRCQQLEEGDRAESALPAGPLDVAPHLFDEGGELAAAYRLRPDADALHDAVEVWGGVQSNLVAMRPQHRGHHRRRAALAFGPGDVHRRDREVWVAQPPEQRTYPLQVKEGVAWAVCRALEVGQPHRQPQGGVVVEAGVAGWEPGVTRSVRHSGGSYRLGLRPRRPNRCLNFSLKRPSRTPPSLPPGPESTGSAGVSPAIFTQVIIQEQQTVPPYRMCSDFVGSSRCRTAPLIPHPMSP